MNEKKTLLTGHYLDELNKKVSKIEKQAKTNRIRQIILLCLMLAVCAGGILYGASSKTDSLDMQYQEFYEAPDRSNLDQDLLSYKDTYQLFVKYYLGNNPWQSMLGGYFYSSDSCLIYPSKDASKTVLRIEGSEFEISEFLADNLNVQNDTVFFRNPISREVYKYDISTHVTTALMIQNAGQFVVCGDDYYYIDLSQSALIRYDSIHGTHECMVDNGVTSFVLAGNDIIYLDTAHTLYCLNTLNNTSTVIADNITSFTYNGALWFQNNDTIYQKKLDEKVINDIELGLQCNRLLGVTETSLLFETEDGVYIHDLTQNTNKKAGDNVLVGASDDMFLWYLISDNTYHLTKH